MSDLESSNFSIIAANNTASPPNGAPEGWAPSSVNNWGREVMAAVKRQFNRAGPTITSGGSANAQTLTYTSATVAALVQGQTYAFIAGFTNTGATTLKVDSLAATAIRLANAALTGGEIIAGQTYVVMYDGTAYQLISPVATGRGGLIGIQIITNTSGATYTPTAGTNSVVVELIGGGAGGGGCALTAGAQAATGSGGGAGGYARKRLTTSFSGVTVTAGAKGTGGTAGANNGTDGGTTSFGAVFTASGGIKGLGSVAYTPPSGFNGGVGGIGSTGDLNVRGQAGGTGIGIVSGFVWGGRGGSNLYGGGGPETVTTTGAAGSTGGGPGAGGGGGCNAASQGTGKAGADGTDGAAIIWEYS